MIPLFLRGHRLQRRMMGRRENGQRQFFYSLNLDEVVPPDHGAVDRQFARSELGPQGVGPFIIRIRAGLPLIRR